MNNQILRLKLKQRLNKLASNDYDNIEDWQILEAFNKAQIEWVRRMLHGNNLYKEGDELSKRRIDDLQILLTELNLTGAVTDGYFETTNFPPEDYLEYKRISVKANQDCCPEPRAMTVYLGEEANVNLYLRDPLKRPDFEWAETFCTLINNTVRIYVRDFNIVNSTLTYYRKPVNIEFAGILNPYTGVTSAVDVISEFKDDIVELILDDTAALIAGDIENFNQMQREQQAAERNN
jgi:hypothetical protein